METFLSNRWVVGIIAGILSGLCVGFLSRFLFSKKNKKEYFERLMLANKEVLCTLKSTISENLLASTEIISSIISSSARKYNIKKSDMYSVEQICDDIIKEIMDSNFISCKTKTDYCNSLSQLKKTKSATDIARLLENELLYLSKRNSESYIFATFSIMLGILTTAMSMIITFFINYKNNFTNLITGYLIGTILPLFITMLTVFISIISYKTYKKNATNELRPKVIEVNKFNKKSTSHNKVTAINILDNKLNTLTNNNNYDNKNK